MIVRMTQKERNNASRTLGSVLGQLTDKRLWRYQLGGSPCRRRAGIDTQIRYIQACQVYGYCIQVRVNKKRFHRILAISSATLDAGRGLLANRFIHYNYIIGGSSSGPMPAAPITMKSSPQSPVQSRRADFGLRTLDYFK